MNSKLECLKESEENGLEILADDPNLDFYNRQPFGENTHERIVFVFSLALK
jgi:hypothetical protein